MKRKWKFIIAVVIAIAVLVTAVLIISNLYSKSALKDIEVGEISTSGIPDGVYSGSSEIAPVKVAVDVTIFDEKITDIDITEHTTGLGEKAESIVDSVTKNQSTQVGIVSGATLSSTAILKAIEDALDNQ